MRIKKTMNDKIKREIIDTIVNTHLSPILQEGDYSEAVEDIKERIVFNLEKYFATLI